MRLNLVRGAALVLWMFSYCGTSIAQYPQWMAELMNIESKMGFQLTSVVPRGNAKILQWRKGEQTKTTVTVTVPGGKVYQFPNEAVFAECVDLGVAEAEKWMDIDMARWRLNDSQKTKLHLAAELQMASLQRTAYADIQKLQHLDIAAPENQEYLNEMLSSLTEFLNPSFRARESLYSKVLSRMRS